MSRKVTLVLPASMRMNASHSSCQLQDVLLSLGISELIRCGNISDPEETLI